MKIKPNRILLYLAATIIGIYSIAPIYSLLITSFMDVRDIVAGYIYPYNPNINAYLRILGYDVQGPYGFLRAYGGSKQLIQGLINISIISPIVMIITLMASVPAGYALGRFKIGRLRTILIILLLGTRSLPPVSIALPYFFLFTQLGLRSTLQGMIIIHLTITIPIITWVLMGFFAALPQDLEKAARIDGCSRLGALTKVVLPLAAPGIAASAMIAFLFSWNDFFYSWLISQGTSAATYNAQLSGFFNFQNEPAMFAAAVTLQIILAAVIASALQKYIAQLKIVDPGTVVVE
ncbi:MAG: carbohydrate ABC transporter permease [Crenarchaeota archaeon]|nr:carbohydrate ABC transporter permease [Thermoproteota archaeon]